MIPKNIELDKDQQLALLNEWNNRPDDPPYIKELIELVFPDIPEDMRDGRSKYGRAVKKFLSEKSLNAKVSHKYYPKEKTELTENQKEYIENNCGAMKPMEMAKVVFDDPRISPLDLRYKVLFDFLKTINQKLEH